MLKFLTRIAKAGVQAPSTGFDGRIYAVGDVHGRFDLFVRMLHAIGQDLAESPPASSLIIFLGDLIDRGPQSARLIELAHELSLHTNRLRFLKGNHEELFLRSVSGEERTAEFFYDIGGRETLQSYGLDAESGDGMATDELVKWMQLHVPVNHIAFIQSFEDIIVQGDYIFVHAGIRPNVPISKQASTDLHWIRKEFINFEGKHPGIVVHGHSISREVDERVNRIGIDTGAYFSGKLTAIVLDGTERRYLTASAEGWDESEQEKEFSFICAQ